MSSPDGLSDHELLLEIRGDLKKHIVRHDETHDEIERDLRSRPTRSEIVALLGAAGVLSGIIFGLS